MYYYFDPTILLVIPGLLLAAWAQAKVSSAFKKYSRVQARAGLTGGQLAQKLLSEAGIYDVKIERVSGTLTDNFNPETKVLSLSGDVCDTNSVAALGVAAHECGHVMQKYSGYAPLALRSIIVPTVTIGSSLSWPIFLVGLIFSWRPLLLAGIILFALTVVFSLVSLPVEFNASNRAVQMLEGTGALQQDELTGAKKVLNAAALTYVASALSAILQLLRLLMLSNRRRD